MLDTRRIARAATATLLMGLAASADAATTTITDTAGGRDSWNEPSNWDNGVPSGADNAVVGVGVVKSA